MTLQVGSQGPLVMAWQTQMVKRYPAYAREADGKPLRIDGYFGYSDRDVQKEWQLRTKQAATFDQASGVVSDKNLRDLGIVATPPNRARHMGIVFRGTGGVIGQDYVSRVCQGAADLVEEFNPDWPASMGGLPPGAPGTPSMNKAVDIGFEAGCRQIESNNRTFVLGGYSAGAIVASKLRMALEPGGRLAAHRGRYVCGFTLGNPSRAFGHTYFLGPVPSGRGISDFNMPNVGWDWCDCVHPDDMYANVPLSDTGEIMTDVYKIITSTSLSDPLGLITAMLPLLLETMSDAGITLPFIGGALGGLTNPAALIGLMLPMLLSMLPGLIAGAGGNTASLTGPAAAMQAAIIGMKFMASGTAPHINYHAWEVWPGQTYLGLATQHVRDWSGRVPARG